MIKSSEKAFALKPLAAAIAALALGVGSPALAGDLHGAQAAPQAAQTSAWAVMAGATLKETLEGWSRVGGYTLLWDSSKDYELRASATFHGSFEEATASLIDSVYEKNPELNAEIAPGQPRPRGLGKPAGQQISLF